MDQKTNKNNLALQKEMRQFYDSLDPNDRASFLERGRKEFEATFEQIKKLVDKTDFDEAEKQKLMEYCINRHREFRAILESSQHD